MRRRALGAVALWRLRCYICCMKTLTITLSDEAAAKLAGHAAENGVTTETLAARVVEDAYDTDWWDELSPEDRAAIEEGCVQAERGETIPHEQVIADMRRKHGW